jgi:hypothetical protein
LLLRSKSARRRHWESPKSTCFSIGGPVHMQAPGAPESVWRELLKQVAVLEREIAELEFDVQGTATSWARDRQRKQRKNLHATICAIFPFLGGSGAAPLPGVLRSTRRPLARPAFGGKSRRRCGRICRLRRYRKRPQSADGCVQRHYRVQSGAPTLVIGYHQPYAYRAPQCRAFVGAESGRLDHSM